jgi:hypothetical protein
METAKPVSSGSVIEYQLVLRGVVVIWIGGVTTAGSQQLRPIDWLSNSGHQRVSVQAYGYVRMAMVYLWV